jgi:hypothetical protein
MKKAGLPVFWQRYCPWKTSPEAKKVAQKIGYPVINQSCCRRWRKRHENLPHPSDLEDMFPMAQNEANQPLAIPLSILKNILLVLTISKFRSLATRPIRLIVFGERESSASVNTRK